MEGRFGVNPGKTEFVAYGKYQFACYAVGTNVVTKEDSLGTILERYVVPVAQPGDVIFISEKMVACTEGRALPVTSIQTGPAARLLSRFVTKSPYGIGLSMPETMQCAIWEAGLPKILLAAFVGLIGKLLHKKGWFYMVAGSRVAAIDGPCSYTLPPYNEYVVLAPLNPNRTARHASRQLGGKLVLVVDANDLGCRILGNSDKSIDKSIYTTLLGQNPLGQSCQCTPIGILRPVP